jgi:hypothetical protein
MKHSRSFKSFGQVFEISQTQETDDVARTSVANIPSLSTKQSFKEAFELCQDSPMEDKIRRLLDSF